MSGRSKVAAELGFELNRLRHQKHWFTDAAVKATLLTAKNLLDFETGSRTPSAYDLEVLLTAYEASDKERSRIIDLHDRVQRHQMVAQGPHRQRATADQTLTSTTPGLPEKPEQSGGVFICYRRSDEPAFAGRIYDRLVGKFSEEQVFMDVDSIELGLDFERELDRVLSQCLAAVVIIGKSWLTVADESGRRRLDDPDDYVRKEIEQSLNRDIRVIPILVDGVPMPRRSDLPESIRGLASRNGRVMSHARFGSDVLELLTALERILDK